MTAKVGVLGGGRMGAGIAHAFLRAGYDVTVVERDAESAAAADDRIRTSLARAAAKDPTAVMPEARPTSIDIAALADCDLVIEAVPEDRTLKHEALARLEAVLDPAALLATNTSSLSIDTLAAQLTHPERFLGLHFFNPVPVSALVEIVTAEATAPATIAEARAYVEAIGKTAILVRDSPGFASSRLGVLLGLEAIRMLEEGVADAADIDRAMELGYRHPMGPLRTTDIVGLDVRLGIAEELHSALGERFAPPELLRRMVADGRLGRKSGEGFYRWDAS